MAETGALGVLRVLIHGTQCADGKLFRRDGLLTVAGHRERAGDLGVRRIDAFIGEVDGAVTQRLPHPHRVGDAELCGLAFVHVFEEHGTSHRDALRRRCVPRVPGHRSVLLGHGTGGAERKINAFCRGASDG